MKKTANLFLAIALLALFDPVHAQNINLYSIDNVRMTLGDAGYTLNGSHMIDARAKLLAPGNFGASGTFPKTVTITDGFSFSSDLEFVTSTPGIDLFYFGSFDKNNTSMIQFTDPELDSLYLWSLRGGKLIIGGVAAAPAFNLLPDILNSRWGFDIGLLTSSNYVPTGAGSSSAIFNGPFGVPASANQGGSIQGYFDSLPTQVIVLANNDSGNPTLILDCKTLDLILADGDGHNDLGGVSPGTGVSTYNDRFWLNTIAYMDALQGPPVISQLWNTLYTGTYSNYQWYLNGNLISGATSSSFTTIQNGTYSVQVTLDCGCTNVSSQEIYVTVGINEKEEVPRVNFWPNPLNANTLTFSGIREPLRVSIINAMGFVVDVENLFPYHNIYDVSKLPAGLFTVLLQNERGVLTGISKLIKQ